MLALVVIQVENIISYFKKRSPRKGKILHFAVAIFSNLKIPQLYKQAKAVIEKTEYK